MQRWIKDAMKGLTAEQDDIARVIYESTFDATPAQLRDIIIEIAESDLPEPAREALARVCRIGLGDHSYLAQ